MPTTMTPAKPLPDLDAVAIAAESSALPTIHEVAAQKCRQVGCENLAARSDGRCYRHSKFRPVRDDVVNDVNERLKEFAPEAADLVMEAARNGVAEGDHKAAAWILTHSGVVKPVGPAQSAPAAGGGLVVNVGIVLPGLPGGD